MYIVIAILSALLILYVGYEVGRDIGYEEGIDATYYKWAERIGMDSVEDEYYIEDFEPTEELNLEYPGYAKTKHKKLKLKKRKRREFRDSYERKEWYFGDLLSVPKPTKWNKCNINKMIKDLSKEVMTEEKYEALYESGK